MTLEDLHGHVGVAYALTYADGVRRRVYVVDREVPFPDGRLIVSRTDPTGVITHANESFVAMSGYSIDELIGQQHYILRHPEMPAVAFAGLWETVARGEKWTGYVKNLRKDGAYYWVFASVVPNVRDGEIVGYTSVRRKPSRAKVADAAALYETLR
jgi:aerotaxis receptor